MASISCSGEVFRGRWINLESPVVAAFGGVLRACDAATWVNYFLVVGGMFLRVQEFVLLAAHT